MPHGPKEIYHGFGETADESEIDFFKQSIAPDSRGVISAFVISVMVSLDGGLTHGI